MINNLKLQWDNIRENVDSKPDVIVQILESMGAEEIRVKSNCITSTCPLHGGDNPGGFIVYYNNNGTSLFKCFTRCGKKGDLARLVMEKYSVGFSQAVEYIGKKVGVKVSGEAIPLTEEQIQEKETRAIRSLIKKVSSERFETFGENLVDDSIKNLKLRPDIYRFLVDAKDKEFVPGLRCRNINPAIIERFQIGFVPSGEWSWTLDDNVFGWREDRVSTPWRDKNGVLIGFAGRRVDSQKQKKWHNIEGTKKQFALYGLSHDKTKQAIKKSGSINLVEGFSDVWRAWHHGCYNTVAVGGTDLSNYQRNLIGSMSLRSIVCMFDSDTPGQQAANRVGLQTQHIARTFIAKLPMGMDPDDILSTELFHRCISNAAKFSGI